MTGWTVGNPKTDGWMKMRTVFAPRARIRAKSRSIAVGSKRDHMYVYPPAAG